MLWVFSLSDGRHSLLVISEARDSTSSWFALQPTF